MPNPNSTSNTDYERVYSPYNSRGYKVTVQKGTSGDSTSPKTYVSQISLVEKKDGGQRSIINLKALNQFVKAEHFKMEGLHLLPDLLQPGNWMAKMDLKNAYAQVSIHPDH